MVYCVSTLNLMGLMESFEEMGFKFKDNQNTIDPEMYMDALRIAFRDNDSKPSEHRAIKESSYAAYKAASEIPSLNRKEIEDSNPLEDWPKDIIFFIRIASLIHGICIELNQSIPFLKILANRAQQFLCSEGSSRVLLNNKIIRECNYSEIQNYSYDKDMVRSKTLGNRKSSYGKSKFGRRLDDFVESLIESKSLLGCQIVVISKGKVIGNTFKGKMGSIDGRQVREDTLFNGFNACLGILVTGILLCVEKQLLSLDDPICHYWDGFIRYGKRNITLRHILTHRSGIHAFFPENFNLTTMFNYKKMVQIIEDTTPQYLPDESTHYNPYLLGWVLSEMISLVTNIPTPEFLQSELFLPLNLENDIFMPVPPANQVKEIEAIQHVECVNNSNRMIEYKDYREKQPEISLPVFTEEANYNSIGSNTQFGLFMKNSIDQIIELGKKHFTDKFQVRNFGIDQHEDNVKNNLNDEETNNIEQQSPSCSEKNMIEQIGTEQISAKNEAIYDRIASVSRIVEFSSISHEEVLKKFSMATYALKGKRNDSNYNDKNLPSSSKDIRKHKKTLTHAQTKKFTPFGILQIKPHVMDPLVQNSHKVMNIWIPPTCGKLTALSLAKFYHHLGCGNIISQNILKQASIPTSTDQTFESLILTGGSSRKWGFGYQIIECIYEPKKYNIHNLMWKSNLVDNSKLTHGQIICGLGHADMGGNIGCTFPDLQLSLAFLTNDYLKGSYASQCILHYVLEKFGLRIINYVPVVP
ncbi:beta-lactamase family protein [Cryptosporidium serpentis]